MELRARLASLAALPLLILAASCLFAACSSSSSPATTPAADGGTCQAYVPPGGFSPTSPTVSFSTAILPIFETSCALPSCHGSGSAPPAGLYLGANGSQTYGNLVNVASTEYPSMVRIKPGDTDNSYLLHRVDDDACTLAGCTSTACAELMPQGGPSLSQANLLAIRGWIAQGALNDLGDAGSSPDGGTGADADTSDGSSVADASGE